MSNYPCGYTEPPSEEDYYDAMRKDLDEEIKELKEEIQGLAAFASRIAAELDCREWVELAQIVNQARWYVDQVKQQQVFIASILPLIQAQHDAEHMVDGFGQKTPRPIDTTLASAKYFLQDAPRPQNWPDAPGMWWLKNGKETYPIEVLTHFYQGKLCFLNPSSGTYWDFYPDKEPKAGVSFLKMHIPEF